MRSTGERADAVDNRHELVAAVGRLLASSGTLTLTELAAEAGVSRSTTYRNFDSPAAAIDAYVDDFLTEFEIAAGRDATTSSDADVTEPAGRLIGICRAWGVVVGQRSHALVHVRSTEGFLARVRRGDPVIGRIHTLVRAAVVDAVNEGAIHTNDFDYAVFLWNLLLDPRELVDLAEDTNQSIAQATERLTNDYLAILQQPVRRQQTESGRT